MHIRRIAAIFKLHVDKLVLASKGMAAKSKYEYGISNQDAELESRSQCGFLGSSLSAPGRRMGSRGASKKRFKAVVGCVSAGGLMDSQW